MLAISIKGELQSFDYKQCGSRPVKTHNMVANQLDTNHINELVRKHDTVFSLLNLARLIPVESL